MTHTTRELAHVPDASTDATVDTTVDTAAVVEIAVYAVEDAGAFAPRQRELHETLRHVGGMLASLACRGIQEADLFADIVVWRDLEAAEDAAGVVEAAPEFAWLRDALGAVRFFGHLSPIDDVDLLRRLGEVAAAPLVEVAVSRPLRPVAHTGAHHLLHRKLAAAPGVRANLGLSGDAGATTADLIGWVDEEAWTSTGRAMMADTELQDAFDPGTDQVLLALFTETGR